MTGMEKPEHKTIAVYISEIDRIYRTGKATEHTYRGVLQQMLSVLMHGHTVLNPTFHVQTSLRLFSRG